MKIEKKAFHYDMSCRYFVTVVKFSSCSGGRRRSSMMSSKSLTQNLNPYSAILWEQVVTWIDEDFNAFCLNLNYFMYFLAFLQHFHNFMVIMGLVVLDSTWEIIWFGSISSLSNNKFHAPFVRPKCFPFHVFFCLECFSLSASVVISSRNSVTIVSARISVLLVLHIYFR